MALLKFTKNIKSFEIRLMQIPNVMSTISTSFTEAQTLCVHYEKIV